MHARCALLVATVAIVLWVLLPCITQRQPDTNGTAATYLGVIIGARSSPPRMGGSIRVSVIRTHLNTRCSEVIVIHHTAHILCERTPVWVFIEALHSETESGSTALLRQARKSLCFCTTESIFLCEQRLQHVWIRAGCGVGRGRRSVAFKHMFSEQKIQKAKLERCRCNIICYAPNYHVFHYSIGKLASISYHSKPVRRWSQRRLRSGLGLG